MNKIGNGNEWCTGCGACLNSCNKNAIYMEYDKEGFFFPQIDEEKCIRCRECEQVCPVINKRNNNNQEHPDFYVGYSRNREIHRNSSSGGVFWHLVEYVISCRGVVYGAALNDDLTVSHYRGETIEECEHFRKSKYLQSNILITFRKAKKDLDKGKMVLFTGTPCQIAGLISYIGEEYSNLFTVDLVCHGVPSQAIFDSYIDYISENERYPISVCWRDKREGWRPNRVTVAFSDGSESVLPSKKNPMQKGFLYNLYLRKSCYKCEFAKLPRVGDLTLGDFWGYKGKLVEENKNEGFSMIIVSNNKGEKLFESIENKLIWEPAEEDYAKLTSRHVHMAPEGNKNRDILMKEFVAGANFEDIKEKYIDTITQYLED